MIDWEGLKALYVAYDAGTMGHGDYVRFSQGLENAFPAILAQHEQDQRVIEAAKKCAGALKLLHDNLFDYNRINKLGGENNQDMRMAREALAEFDKVTK